MEKGCGRDTGKIMIIKNGKIVTANKIFKADLVIKNGKISQIAASTSEKDDVLDASGLCILPGLIDAHVHLRDPEATYKEDFYTGTSAALAGGVTTIMDMPNYRNPPTTTRKAYEEKKRIAAKKAVCDYRLHFGASNNNYEEVAKSKSNSLKFFMTNTNSELTITSLASLNKHFSLFPKDKPICVHVEDDEAVNVFSEVHTKHEDIRNPISTYLGLIKVLSMAEYYKRRVHICHVSTAKELELIRIFRNGNISCEVTPHHLFLTTKMLKKLKTFGKVNPPLRDEKAVAGLWRSLDKINIIASDHAPHTKEEKLSPEPPSGIAGIETMLPLLLDAYNKRRITLQRIVELTSRNPAKLFNIKNKGDVKLGYPADLVLVNLDEKWIVKNENLKTKCKISPYDGMKLKGKVVKVILRGKEVYDEGNILAKRGYGKFID